MKYNEYHQPTNVAFSYYEYLKLELARFLRHGLNVNIDFVGYTVT